MEETSQSEDFNILPLFPEGFVLTDGIYRLPNPTALPYAAAEYLKIPRKDIQDMLAQTDNNQMLQATLEYFTFMAQAANDNPNGSRITFARIPGELTRVVHAEGVIWVT